jgi:hypothetical protein
VCLFGPAIGENAKADNCKAESKDQWQPATVF